ncbi:MAG: o-succinylbenzoate synthase [Ignavibacteriaceae bacterium]
MKNLSLTFSSYNLKFKNPFESSKGSLNERNGFLIHLKSSSGKTGVGDAAPLPESGSESYAEAENELKKLKLNLKINFHDIENSITQSLSSLDKFPALHHGVEQALINLISKENNLSINEILNESSNNRINVNAVIGFLTPDESAEEAQKLIRQGFTTLKVKAGRDKFEDDLNCLKAIRESAGTKIKLRVDANGKWELNEAIKNLKRMKLIDPEYVEQPLNGLANFIKLKNKTGVPLAVDESIRTIKDAVEFIQHKAVSFVILKPMMLGGIIPVMNIKNFAEQNGLKVVITSSFESVVGRSMAIFAASTVKEQLAHGLATGNYFEKDLFADPYPVKNGMISLEAK